VDVALADLTPWTVTHLHGGRTAPASDGWTENAALPGQATLARYDNDQPATLLWYHDHAMGITRYNAMAGLTGLYLIRDGEEVALGLPGGAHEIPLLIQDRNLEADGGGALTGRRLHKIEDDPSALQYPAERRYGRMVSEGGVSLARLVCAVAFPREVVRRRRARTRATTDVRASRWSCGPIAPARPMRVGDVEEIARRFHRPRAAPIVARRGHRRGVPQQLLRDREIGPGVEQVAGEGAAEIVRREVLHPGSRGPALQHVVDRLGVERAEPDLAPLRDRHEQRPRPIAPDREPVVERGHRACGGVGRPLAAPLAVEDAQLAALAIPVGDDRAPPTRRAAARPRRRPRGARPARRPSWTGPPGGRRCAGGVPHADPRARSRPSAPGGRGGAPPRAGRRGCG